MCPATTAKTNRTIARRTSRLMRGSWRRSGKERSPSALRSAGKVPRVADGRKGPERCLRPVGSRPSRGRTERSNAVTRAAAAFGEDHLGSRHHEMALRVGPHQAEHHDAMPSFAGVAKAQTLSQPFVDRARRELFARHELVGDVQDDDLIDHPVLTNLGPEPHL